MKSLEHFYFALILLLCILFATQGYCKSESEKICEKELAEVVTHGVISETTKGQKKEVMEVHNSGLKVELHKYPEILPFSDYLVRTRTIGPASPDSPEFKEINRIIDLSGEVMDARRGWAINETRRADAREFWRQTTYFETFEVLGGGWGQKETTETRAFLGLATAQSATEENSSERLPIFNLKDENTGQTWELALEKMRDEIGMLFEGKAYAIFKPGEGYFLDSLSSRAYVWSEVFNKMKKDAKSNPKVLFEKCFITYGDETSLRFWTRMNKKFEILDSEGFPPLFENGTLWHALRIAPIDLVEDHEKYPIGHVISTPGSPIKVTTPNNGTFMADGDYGVYYPNFRYSSTNRYSGDFHFISLVKQEIRPGLWVKAGGRIILRDGKITGMESIEGRSPGSPAEYNDSVWVAAGGSYHDNAQFEKLAYPLTYFDGRVTIPTGSSLTLKDDEPMTIEIGDKDAEIYPGMWARKGASIFIWPKSLRPSRQDPKADLIFWINSVAKPIKASNGDIIYNEWGLSGVKVTFIKNSKDILIEETKKWGGLPEGVHLF